MSRVSLFVVLLGWLLIKTVAAQTVVFERFSTKDGLPSPTIFRVEPHPESGLLWVGTLNGLVSYDGHHFLSHDFSNPVINNMVLSIEHRNRTSSFLAYYNESIYLLESNKLNTLELRKEDRELFDSTSPGIHYMETDRWNRHWFLSIAGLLFYRDSTNWELFQWPGEDVYYGYVYQLPGGPLYISTSEGLIEKQPGKTRVLFKNELDSLEVDAMTHDLWGRLWLTGEGKVFYKEGEELVPVFEVDGHSGRSILRADTEGRIWFLSGHRGLYLLNDTGMVMEVNKHIWDRMPLINDLNFDREGNIWIGTFGDGLYRVRLERHHFRVPIRNNPNRPLSHVLAKKDGQIMVATFGDVLVGDAKALEPMDSELISDDELVFQLCEEPEGTVLFGTPLQLGRISNKQVKLIQDEQGCTCMKIDKKNGLWCGSFKGFCYFKDRKNAQEWDCFKMPYRTNDLEIDENEILWIATPKGLYTYNGEKIQLQPAQDSTQEYVVRMFIDSKKRMWCSTQNGLRVLEKGKWKSYYVKDGLPNRQCRSFVEDRSGRIWVSTDLGLCYFDGNGRFYSVQHCFPEVTRQKITKLSLDQQGMILASSNQSVFQLNPDQLTAGSVSPIPHIEEVSSGEHRLPLHLAGSLPYKNNNLQVEFSGVSFRYPEYVKCRYRLVGLKEGWRESTTNQVDFRSLPPGDYRFELTTRFDFQSEWSAPNSYSFSVHRPFWLEWWWWTLEGLAGLGLIYLVSKWQVNKSRRKEDLKRQVEGQLSDLKQQALAAMMNPHFFANVISSIQDYLHTHRKEEVEQYLTDFAHLVRLNLSLAAETGINLDEEVRRLQLYLMIEQRRFDGRFQYKIEVDSELRNAGIKVLNHLIQPLVENAIWHGLLPRKGRGSVWVRFMGGPNGKIRIEVEDNGVGLAYHKERNAGRIHQSMGLSIIRERLKVSGKSHLFLLKETGEPNSLTTGTLAVLEVDELD